MPKIVYICDKCGSKFDSHAYAIKCESSHPSATLFEIRDMKFRDGISPKYALMPNRIKLHFKGTDEYGEDVAWYVKE